jgi:hypothetical protein
VVFPAKLQSYSRVAQVVEQVTVNHRVGGSSPSSGAFFFDPKLHRLLKRALPKGSARFAY